MKNEYYAISIFALIITSTISPIYAEVFDMKTDKQSYMKNDTITFHGKVEEKDSGLVTIVIRDPNDTFVLLAQTLIEPDNTFTKSVKINEKFVEHGIYNATGFIVNMTAGSKVSFGVSTNGIPIVFTEEKSNSNEKINEETILKPQEGPKQNTEPVPQAAPEPKEPTTSETEKPIPAPFVDPSKDPQYYIDRYNNEPSYKAWFEKNYPQYTSIHEAVGIKEKTLADFVDPDKDPLYYVDRYYNEPSYKSWFDRNYPGMTIEDAVGYVQPEKSTDIIRNKILPNAEATSAISEPMIGNVPEISQIILAIVGVGTLVGATYGIKRMNVQGLDIRSLLTKTDRLFKPAFGSDPVSIIQTRLAKGEITEDEFHRLKRLIKKRR